jgi:TRAP-type C4-dicarboxylate transport system substrate-binding protein
MDTSPGARRSGRRRGARQLAYWLIAIMVLSACGGADDTAVAPTEPDGAETAEPTTDEATPEVDDEDEGDVGEEGETFSLRYGAYLPEGTTAIQDSLFFIDRAVELVANETNHTLEFENFLGGSLVSGAETVPAIREGRIDLGFVAPAFSPSDLPLTQVSTIPFLSSSPMAALRANDQMAQQNDDYRDEWVERNGMVPVLWVQAGNATTGFSEPVTSIDELSGKRVRTIGLHAAALERVGVDATAMDTSEMYEAIDRGVLDGFASFPFSTSVFAFSLQEVAPHFIDTGLGQYTTGAVAFNVDIWEGLPSEVQDLLRQAAAETYDEFVVANLEPLDETACDMVLENGSVTALPEDEVEQWREDVFDDILEQWISTAAAETDLSEDEAAAFVDEYRELESEFAAGEDYVDGLQACIQRAG